MKNKLVEERETVGSILMSNSTKAALWAKSRGGQLVLIYIEGNGFFFKEFGMKPDIVYHQRKLKTTIISKCGPCHHLFLHLVFFFFIHFRTSRSNVCLPCLQKAICEFYL
jgi:hypothetical protein